MCDRAIVILVLLMTMSGCSDNKTPDDLVVEDASWDSVIDASVEDATAPDASAHPIPCSGVEGDEFRTMCDPSPLTPGVYCCPAVVTSDCAYNGGSIRPGQSCEAECDGCPTDTVDNSDGCPVVVEGDGPNCDGE